MRGIRDHELTRLFFSRIGQTRMVLWHNRFCVNAFRTYELRRNIERIMSPSCVTAYVVSSNCKRVLWKMRASHSEPRWPLCATDSNVAAQPTMLLSFLFSVITRRQTGSVWYVRPSVRTHAPICHPQSCQNFVCELGDIAVLGVPPTPNYADLEKVFQ